MNRILVNSIQDPNIRQPFMGPSLQFLQDANQDMINGLCYSIMGPDLYHQMVATQVGVAMYGLDQPDPDTINGGWILYNGELYACAGATGVSSFVNPPTFQLGTSYAAFDPTKFTDNIYRNVHEIRTIDIVDDTSGIFDYINLLYVNKTRPKMVVCNQQSTVFVSGFTNTLLYSNEIYDLDNMYNPGTGRFVPNKVGWYEVNVGCIVDIGSSLSVGATLRLCKNGSVIVNLDINEYLTGGGKTSTLHGSYIFYASNTTDYYTIELAYNSSVSSSTFYGPLTYKYIPNME